MPNKISNADLHRLDVEAYRKAQKKPIVLVLDNIRSQHNIGAAFRTGDAFRIQSICLCGICACPPSAEMHKSALGAEDSVEWKYYSSTMDAINELKAQGYTILAVEQVEGSISLENFASEDGKSYALVFGNEVYGVDQDVVDNCDGSIEIPQYGTKHSLNVSVSIGVVLWQVIQRM